MKKRMLSALLAASMVLTMVPAAFAGDTETAITWDDDNRYTLSEDEDWGDTYTIAADTNATYTIALDTHTLTVNNIHVGKNSHLRIMNNQEWTETGRVDADENSTIKFHLEGGVSVQDTTFAKPVEIYAINADVNEGIYKGITIGTADFEQGLTLHEGACASISDAGQATGTITVESDALLETSGPVDTVIAEDGASLYFNSGVEELIIPENAKNITIDGVSKVRNIIIRSATGDRPNYIGVESLWNIENGSLSFSTRAEIDGQSTPAILLDEVYNAYIVNSDTKYLVITAIPNNGYKVDTITVQNRLNTQFDYVRVSGNDYIYEMPSPYGVTVDVSFTEVGGSSGGSSGGGGGASSSQTTTNPDGSTTTIVTNPDGSTVETTKNPDGSIEIIETKKDGTVTTTTTDADGNKTKVVENTDGSSETTVTNKDGSSSKTTISSSGQVTAEVTLPSSVVSSAESKGETIALPMPSVSASSNKQYAPTVTVNLPSGKDVKVEIPVENVNAGTVAVLVKADGTEEVLKMTVETDNGITVTLNDGDTVKVVNNATSFSDVPSSYWGADAVAFATSRELFNGVSSTSFAPESAMNRAMIVTVLARLEGVDTTGGANWYDAGRAWAMEKGISDGSNMSGNLSREQLATMLYRYAGEPTASSGMGGYTDAASVSDYAQQAMAWAVSEGIITGYTANTLNPKGEATRAQVATMLMRFCETVAK